MLRRSSRIRPALPLRYRILDSREHSVFLGRAHYRHGLRVPLEEHVLVMAPPRTFKTAFLADVIMRCRGPVIATSTKPDLFKLTSAVRSFLGPMQVFNPQHIGGVLSTFCWSPVDGCQDPATAIRRADAFAFAVSQKGVQDGTFWSAKASDYLRGYFHAAALAQYDLRAVAAWVSGADPDVPERILAAAGAHPRTPGHGASEASGPAPRRARRRSGPAAAPASPSPRFGGGSSAGENLIRVAQDHRAGEPVVQCLVLLARDEQHERGEQGEYAKEVIDDAPGDLTQRHKPEAGYPVGLRPPGPHPEHLQRRSLPVAPGDQAPDDVTDAKRDDG
jgi:hypothetical protein